jgi:hypothetical protein
LRSGALSPDPLNLVTIKRRVRAHKREAIGNCLRHQDTVERIAMVQRKPGDFVRMAKPDREQADPVRPQVLGDERIERLGDGQAAQPFDRGFPDARDAQEQLVPALSDRALRYSTLGLP